MTRRPPHAEVPAGERLFRRLRREHFDGDRVLEDAIDSEGTSCDREAHRPDPLALRSEQHPAVGWVRAGDVPVDLVPPSHTVSPPVVWEYFVVDDPTDANDAHCEIRVRRIGRRPSLENDIAVKKRPYEVRTWLKAQLAARFRVLPD